MKIRNAPHKSNNSRSGKAKAAIPIAGILAASALISGLSFPTGSEIAIAQQNMTATNATATNATATNATATNATGATAGNQTNPTMSGGNNTGGATGGEASTGGSQAGGGGSSDPLAGIFGGGQ